MSLCIDMPGVLVVQFDGRIYKNSQVENTPEKQPSIPVWAK